PPADPSRSARPIPRPDSPSRSAHPNPICTPLAGIPVQIGTRCADRDEVCRSGMEGYRGIARARGRDGGNRLEPVTDSPVSALFDPAEWTLAPGADVYTDITAHVSRDGRIARIAFDRPEVRNAFRPHTVDELYRALDAAR